MYSNFEKENLIWGYEKHQKIRVLSSNFLGLKNANYMKSIEKYLLCTEKQFLVRKCFQMVKIWIYLNETELKRGIL